jgi:exopolyphosphatase/guanosine-5'-triphosphate,3'-diphosphate pyrophosphatase
MLLAVMDLGSNSFKMTVAQWEGDNVDKRPYRVLHKERHPVQLGGSVFSGGRISEKDFKEGIKAIAKMQNRLREFASPVLRVVATSAIRDSTNGKLFVQEAKFRLGIPVEVITGAEEARLIGRGLTLEYPDTARGALVDIGGGSTEVASFGKGWSTNYLESFRIGSVRLATRHFRESVKADPVVIRAEVREQLKGRPPRKIDKLVGSAGAIQSLGRILAASMDHPVIRRADLDAWIEAHFSTAPAELAVKYDLTPSRARIVVPGAMILSEVLAWLGRDEITVTNMTLRDGLMVDLVQNWQSSESKIIQSGAGKSTLPSAVKRTEENRELLKYLEATAQRFLGDLAHASYISVLALSVFEQMLEAGFPLLADDRRILLIAAYLHDVGRIISDGSHHKHSAYIIRHLRIPGCSPLDAKKAALAALYHRKETPPKKDPLPGDVRGIHAEQVRRVVGILRLVDGLDEQHTQGIKTLKMRFSKKNVLIELAQHKHEPSSTAYFRDKAAYFEELFGVKIVSFVRPRS